MSKCVYRSLPSLKEARNRATSIDEGLVSIHVPPRLAKFAIGKKAFLKTYGCQANIRDEEVMAGYLLKAGFTLTDVASEADLAIINTCAVRENAEDKVYGEIGSFKVNKEKNDSFILAVTGCMMQEEGVAEYLMRTYPYVSLVFGTHNTHHVLDLLEEVISKKERLVDVLSFPKELAEGLPSYRKSPFEAFVNISYGCNKFCTYCIVPYTRGPERSRSVKSILDECKELVNEGYKQITLLGQNVNSYGLDFKDGTSFASLLDQVADLGVKRLRFLTSYPSQFSDEMIAVMKKHDNIDKWLHLPVQSGSSSCLKRMGRRYSREEYLDLVSRIRKEIPDIVLTTDIIVGFPNETDEEFEETLTLAKEVGYSAAFTFIYSPRKGTPAAKIVDNVTDEEKHKRFDRLKEVIEESTSKHSLSMVGETFDVLVEGPSKRDPEVLSGYAGNGKLINFRGPSYLTGCLVKVKVDESKTYSLRGSLVNDPLIEKATDVSFMLQTDPVLREYSKISEELSSNEEIKELGESLASSKKEMALAIGDDKLYQEKKKEYERILKLISSHPLLANQKYLLEEVERKLLFVRDSLK